MTNAQKEVRRGGLSVTAQQQEVIDHVLSRPVTVVGAGAGSGKTHTTIATVLELIDRGEARLDQFVLITFTNKAADELRARLERELALRIEASGESNPSACPRWLTEQERLTAAYIGTIHGFCSQLLRLFGYEERLARESNVTMAMYRLGRAIEDAAERELNAPDMQLLQPEFAWREHEMRDMAVRILSAIRNRGLSAQQVLTDTRGQDTDVGKPYRVRMAEFIADCGAAYDESKREDAVLDANDLVLRTAEMLSGPGGAQVTGRLASRYRFLFIDEFQDTDVVQKRIVDALKPHVKLLVVGDRKQSIYRFRAADESLLLKLAVENDVPMLKLSLSARPTAALLHVQNVLFENMGRRYPVLRDPLQVLGQQRGTGNPNLAPLTYIAAGNTIRSRTVATADAIRQLVGQPFIDSSIATTRTVEAGDIAVLLRSNRRLREYTEQLQSLLGPRGIDVRADEGGGLFQQPEIVSTYHMLRLLLRYPDDMALSLALHTPYFADIQVSAKEQELLQAGPADETPFSDWFEDQYTEHAQRLSQLRAQARIATVPQLLGQLYNAFNILEHYRKRTDRQAAGNLEKLREQARALFDREQALTLVQFVDWLQTALLTARDESEALVPSDEVVDRPRFVRIMTIHRAKGLEFPFVFIPEVQTPVTQQDEPDFVLAPQWGLDIRLPAASLDTRSLRFQNQLTVDNQARLEEEMRILYVAITRAQIGVTLIGNANSSVSDPSSRYYAWKDEILAAWPALEPLGARRQ